LRSSLLSGGLLFIAVLFVGSAFGADTETDIVDRYLTAAQMQQTILRGVSMEVDIDASVPKLQKNGKLHALRKISKLGKVTYRMLGFNGDNSVKKDVIARYLSAEVQAQGGPNLAITPTNYKFKFKGVQKREGSSVYVLSVSPRRKEVGLFKGELWLDKDTCMPLRETGKFVKSPSIFLSKMEFTRVYDIKDGVAIPQRISSLVSTRLFGPVELHVNFTNISKDSEDEEAVASALEGQE
jgi:hypothetical protein